MTEIRPIREGELEAVEEIYGRVFGGQSLDFWRRRYQWQFLSNPVTRVRPSPMWVGVKEGKIVGFIASFPARLKVLDKEIIVLCPCDFMVAPEVRREGLGERLLKTYLQETAGLCIAPAYSPSNARLLARLGYRPVYAQPAFVRPIRGSRMIRTRFRGKEAGSSPKKAMMRPLAAVVGGAGGGAFAVMNALRSPRPKGGLHIEIDPVFGDDFDRLWQDAAAEIPVLFVRDALTLQWRFREDPLTRHTVFAARDGAGGLAGYAVVCESKHHTLRAAKVMDLFCAPSRAGEVVGTLAAAVVDHCQGLGFDFITFKGLHPRIRAELRRSFYLKAPGRPFPAMCIVPDEGLAESIFAADLWHLSHSDGDEGFVP
jgi:predicted N-acetyltransferase YhbS